MISTKQDERKQKPGVCSGGSRLHCDSSLGGRWVEGAGGGKAALCLKSVQNPDSM